MKTRQDIYERLTQKFRPITEKLDEYGKTDLDGILWAVAQEIELDILEASRLMVLQETTGRPPCVRSSSEPLELYPVGC